MFFIGTTKPCHAACISPRQNKKDDVTSTPAAALKIEDIGAECIWQQTIVIKARRQKKHGAGSR
ncbi:hypothetical protein [Serratia rubidaea]|uniref:hypothetical protein n=1 Tax=Serratia rubidaea TaxID=61652 RepID=UPI00243060F2|nr:hypothetical protein [Serratia rubidaea]MCR0998346.1 hypothetical protein [Serratia rubidaea]